MRRFSTVIGLPLASQEMFMSAMRQVAFHCGTGVSAVRSAFAERSTEPLKTRLEIAGICKRARSCESSGSDSQISVFSIFTSALQLPDEDAVKSANSCSFVLSRRIEASPVTSTPTNRKDGRMFTHAVNGQSRTWPVAWMTYRPSVPRETA